MTTAAINAASPFQWLADFCNDRDGAGNFLSGVHQVLSFLERTSWLSHPSKEHSSAFRAVIGVAGSAFFVPGAVAQGASFAKKACEHFFIPVKAVEWKEVKRGESQVTVLGKEALLTAEMATLALQFVYESVPSMIGVASKLVRAQFMGSVFGFVARSHDIWQVTREEMRSEHVSVQRLGVIKIVKALTSIASATLTIGRIGGAVYYPAMSAWIVANPFAGVALGTAWLALEVGTFFYGKYLKDLGHIKD